MSKGVVLLSGGLDSATVAYVAKEECSDLYGLTFDYGQKHLREWLSAEAIAKSLELEDWLVADLKVLKTIGGSSLLGCGEVPKDEVDGIPSTWVPQRNAIFLGVAFAWAEVLGVNKVYTGVNAVDYSGYPDCRQEFITAMEEALNLASKRFVESGERISIETPLINLTKKEIISLGLKYKVPYNLTWSCYNGRERACGVCPSCRIRLKAFEDLGLKDPIAYES